MRPYTRYPACNTAGFFFAFYFFREGGPVGHKHNLYANRDWGGRVGGPGGHKQGATNCRSVIMSH